MNRHFTRLKKFIGGTLLVIFSTIGLYYLLFLRYRIEDSDLNEASRVRWGVQLDPDVNQELRLMNVGQCSFEHITRARITILQLGIDSMHRPSEKLLDRLREFQKTAPKPVKIRIFPKGETAKWEEINL